MINLLGNHLVLIYFIGIIAFWPSVPKIKWYNDICIVSDKSDDDTMSYSGMQTFLSIGRSIVVAISLLILIGKVIGIASKKYRTVLHNEN